MKRFSLSLLLGLSALLFAACGTAPAPIAPAAPTVAPAEPAGLPATEASAPADAPQANLTDSCVEHYDPAVDYFPEKITIEDSVGWTVEYFNHYKVVTVLNPWRDAEVDFRYVLLQCGTPPPDDVGDAQVIEVPIDTIVTMSTTHLPHLSKLGLLDRLLAVDAFQYINTPEVVALIEAGELQEIGSGSEINVELAIDLQPDMIMTYGVGSPENDSHPVLIEAGLKVAMNAEYMETTPLGRAEWVKFTGLFFNEEAAATSAYNDIAGRYRDIAALTATIAERPAVFTGAPFQGTWYMPGGNSYVAALLADAGAAYLWADDDSIGSQQLSFEAVFERAADAEFWLNTSSWQSLADGLAADERFAAFAAFENGNVFNNNARLNPNGGNDYWETGVTNPDLVLADLIAIFHPDLLPEHEFVFYQQLQ
jgi:iron complex transport system substrate-binding protein